MVYFNWDRFHCFIVSWALLSWWNQWNMTVKLNERMSLLTLDTSSSQVWTRDRRLVRWSAARLEEEVGDGEAAIPSCCSVPGWTSCSPLFPWWMSCPSPAWRSSSEAVTATAASGCRSPGAVLLHRIFTCWMSSCFRTAWRSACRALKLTAPTWGVPMDTFNRSYKLRRSSDILLLCVKSALS